MNYLKDKTIVDLFQEQSEKTPDNIAVVFGNQQLTYEQLNQKSDQLAAYLLRLKNESNNCPLITGNCIVAVCMERSQDMVVSLLGVLKAGCAYLPLDPDYPLERLKFMLGDSCAPVLLSRTNLLKRLPESQAKVICPDNELKQIEAVRSKNRSVKPGVDDLAYVIYTSGSTGKPKGVMIRHGGLTNMVCWYNRHFSVTQSDRAPLLASPAFDASVVELWPYLCAGAGVYPAKTETVVSSSASFKAWLDQNKITIALLPTAIMKDFLEENRQKPTTLRCVLTGGDVLRSFTPLGCRFKFYNNYGPTENTVITTSGEVPVASNPDNPELPSIGRPIDNTQIHILDPNLNPTPPGKPGELCISGVGLAAGYINRPELMSEKFTEIMKSGKPVRIYKTGDSARLLPDGNIEFLGRLDNQVKVRGFRIELGEIETALSRHANVKNAAIVVHDRENNPSLAAYLTLSAPIDNTQKALGDWLRAELPEYMIPASFTVLEQMPFTSSGKIDRKSLPEPEIYRSEFTAPRTKSEQWIAGVWQELLNTYRIGIHDDFFALGGNSLSGMRFINRLNQKTGEIFYIFSLFKAPTVARFAEYLKRNYPTDVSKIEGTSSILETVGSGTVKRVTEERIREFRQLLPEYSLNKRDNSGKNPPAVFILAPPRSGTTLLRVVLGGHPRLFAPPEMELLGFNTLKERYERCMDYNPTWLQGTIRALMEIENCEVKEAKQIMARYESSNLDIKQFYKVLQTALESRILVDKTPSYAAYVNIMNRAEEYFDNAKYIHLLRHPFGMIHSFEKARIDQIISSHPYIYHFNAFARNSTGVEMGELLWVLYHQNILDFFKTVPESRQYALKFEDLVKHPHSTIENLCRFLGIDFHPDMALPYEDKKRSMTDGLYAEGGMLGDVKFHKHSRIDPSVAEGWRESYHHDFLGEVTWKLAEQLGYQREPSLTGIPLAPRNKPLPLSFAQRRLWFLSQFEGQSSAYNIHVSLNLEGRLNENALRRALTALTERHESLCSCFPVSDGEPEIKINKTYDPLTVIDLTGLPERSKQRRINELFDNQANTVFNLTTGPLFSVQLIHLKGQNYILLCTQHHMISDGWSMDVLMRELTGLYNAFSGNEKPDLPELHVQYVDYAVRQKNWMQDQRFRKQLHYWKDKLAGLPEMLNLPADFPRPAVISYKGNRLQTLLDQKRSQEVKKLSHLNNVTLFMTFLTAFKVLLYRYSEMTDIAVGSPVSGRNHYQTEVLIGFFVNMLVFRTKLNSDQSFQEMLKHVRQTALDAYAAQDVPFEYLVEQLNPSRSRSSSPLFQVVFAFQNAPHEIPELKGLQTSFLKSKHRTSKFDLTLSVRENKNTFEFTWEYSTDLFRTDTIKRMADNFSILLQGILDKPETPIRQLPLLSELEKQQLFVWNQTGVDYPLNKTIVDLFKEQVEKNPANIAATFELQKITYSQLNEKANQLANFLLSLKNETDSNSLITGNCFLGLCMERSIEMLVSLLGILKAGCAYAPLDPNYPTERLHFILKDLSSPVLLTQNSLLERLPKSKAKFVLLDDDWKEISKYSTANPAMRNHPKDSAYAVYTSGSTGRPKGVVIKHKSLANLVYWHIQQFSVTQSDRASMSASPSFDASVWELWPYLCVGACVFPIKDELTVSTPALLKAWLKEKGITITFIPSPLIKDFLTETIQTPLLRTVLTGGDVLRTYPTPDCGFKLYNNYGPTENTVVTTSMEVPFASKTGNPALPSIGRAISNTQIYILDTHHNQTPIGVPGELYIAGTGLAEGYLNRPKLTAEKFIEIKICDKFKRVYKTGDLAKQLPDGNFEFLGRLDRQVKLRGFRIELSEIESTLNLHERVKQSVVNLLNRNGNPMITAYVTVNNHRSGEVNHQPFDKGGQIPPPGKPTPKNRKDVTPETGSSDLINELREWLKARLPVYMLPSGFIILDKIPLTPNNKVDYNALPEPELELYVEHEPPGTQTEHHLCNLWLQVLGREVDNIRVNFFDAGGHSLLAAKLISRIRDRFGIDMPLREVFDRPVLKEQASWLDGQRKGSELPQIKPLPKDEPLQLSFAQQRLWFFSRLEGKSSTYNIPAALRLEGKLNKRALKEAFTSLIKRQESLRMVFPTVNGKAKALVTGVFNPLKVIDLSAKPKPEQKRLVDELISDHAQNPFDLSSGPLFSLRLIKLDEQNAVLSLNMHHIIGDGWSMQVLMRELTILYNTFCNGPGEKRLNPLSIQYTDFAAWQRELFQGEFLNSQLHYWKDKLTGSPELLNLPTDFPRPPAMSYKGKRLQSTLSTEITHAIKELSRKKGSTEFMTLLTSFKVLMCRYSGQFDLTVGTPFANRSHLQTENLIGFFVNTLVLRTQINANDTFPELLNRVRRTSIEAYENRDLPFEHLVDMMNPERSLSRSPLFQVMFAVQNEPEQELQFTGLKALFLEPEYTTSKFDLTLHIEERNGYYICNWVYCPDLFRHDTIAKMSEHFNVLLKGIVNNPEQPLNQLPLLTEKDKQKLWSWNQTKIDYPKDKTIVDLFQEQVEKTPDNTAVVFSTTGSRQGPEQQLTYRQLNQKADRLAAYILSLKSSMNYDHLTAPDRQMITDNSLIGLFMERSLDMVISLLGVLKARCAYVPFDPDYPSKRLAFMLNDSTVRILLTHSYLKEKLPKTSAKVVCLDEGSVADDFLYDQKEPLTKIKPDDLAYAIYTSGSTGNPKAALNTHRGILNRILWMQDEYCLTPGDAVLQKTPFSFDVSVWEFFWPLLTGARLVVAGPGQHKDPSSLIDLIAGEGITTMHFVPSMLNTFLEAPELEKAKRLKRVICSGEALSGELERKFFKGLPKTELHNLYGPTEAAIDVTYWKCDRANKLPTAPIGRPVANTQIHILDKFLNHVPIGVSGELHIGGVQVGRGYLNRPELTAEKFINDPFRQDAEALLYKSGDLARHLPDGSIEFIGRIDNQIKIRGFRIELGEIEACLTSCPIVKEAVVEASGSDEAKIITAYITVNEEFNVEKLREYVNASLPAHMVPTHYVELEALPLLHNGKTDRKALQAIKPLESVKEYQAPQNDLEMELCEIWKKQIKTEHIGTEVNFFEAGGNSLSLVRVHWEIEKKYPQITLMDLFAYPNVKELAGLILKGKDHSIVKIEPLMLDKKYFSTENAPGGLEFTLNNELSGKLKQFGHSKNLDVQHILSASFSYLLYEISNQSIIHYYTALNEEMIITIRHDYNDIDSITDLLTSSQSQYQKPGQSHPVESFMKTGVNPGLQGVLPLYTNTGNREFENSDLHLQTNINNGATEMTLRFSARMNTNEMNRLPGLYVAILEEMIKP